MIDKLIGKYLVGLLILSVFLGIVIVPVERGHMINSYADSLWWVVTTITSVGYGDLVPVTGLGRVIGGVLMTAGLMLFLLVISVLSHKLIRIEEKYWHRRLQKQLDSINNKIYRLEKKLDYLIKGK